MEFEMELDIVKVKDLLMCPSSDADFTEAVTPGVAHCLRDFAFGSGNGEATIHNDCLYVTF
jgi:hypothetical protein